MYQAIPYNADRLPACPRRSEQAEAEGAAGQESGLAARRRGGEGRRQGGGEEGAVLPYQLSFPAELAAAVAGNAGGKAVVALPAVFVGGRILGGLDWLMAVHISGELVPILKDAGALWL
ncbi:monothiol glutaredoxin-S9-like [Triticum aestivum]|uniref:monothiol glutaredoxin-S9-like n=1 Tax=Triticum aestivum TaxID=4565 RepID=UPI001D02351E|nr:monothiol glutaredoxin-S9-like [Triticum aestivum]